MQNRLRTPFFLLSLLAIALVVLVERGSGTKDAARLLGYLQPAKGVQIQIKLDTQALGGELSQKLNQAMSDHPDTLAYLGNMPSQVQGYAIRSMQYVDGCLLFTVLLMGLSLVLPQHIHAKAQGGITLFFAITLITTAIAWIFEVLFRLIAMTTLLISLPFGTLIYLFTYGHFPRGAMTAVLGGLFLLRILFGILLLLAHQGFLKNTGLVIFTAAAFVAGLVVSFLYGIVPGILVSITDAIAAIVVAIIGIILGVVLAVQSIPSIVVTVKSLVQTPVAV